MKLFPVIFLHVAIKIILSDNSQLLCNSYHLLLIGRRKIYPSFTFQIVVLSAHISYHAIAESIRHTDSECINRAHKATGITHFLVRTVIITRAVLRFQSVRIHNRQKNPLCRSMFQCYPAQTGGSTRTSFGGTQAERIGN